MRLFATITIAIIIFAVVVSTVYLFWRGNMVTDNKMPTDVVSVAPTSSAMTQIVSPTPTPMASILPSAKTITMNFTTQAPLTNWDALHEEACEEASLIMVYHYYQKTVIGGKDQAEKEIQDLVAYETAHGYGTSVTMEQLKQIAKDYYRMGNSRVLENPTINDLKNEVNLGNPVIVPAAGRELKNPNFKSPGPVYHNLVIKGYDSEAGVFITNDPGTRNGENYKYVYSVLMNAMHNWDATNIDNGAKEVLVFD